MAMAIAPLDFLSTRLFHSSYTNVFAYGTTEYQIAFSGSALVVPHKYDMVKVAVLWENLMRAAVHLE